MIQLFVDLRSSKTQVNCFICSTKVEIIDLKKKSKNEEKDAMGEVPFQAQLQTALASQTKAQLY